MNKRIVYNSKLDNSVIVACPSDWAIQVMGCGGAWPEMPWYYPGFEKNQIERMIARGVPADVAARHANAMMVGGLTTAEALELIRDRDCAPRGYAIELWDAADVPKDRWYRNAWRRSHNGGPISIDLELARPLQFSQAYEASRIENARREQSFEYLPPLEIDWEAFRRQIRRARCVEELRTVWPEGLILPAV